MEYCFYFITANIRHNIIILAICRKLYLYSFINSNQCFRGFLIRSQPQFAHCRIIFRSYKSLQLIYIFIYICHRIFSLLNGICSFSLSPVPISIFIIICIISGKSIGYCTFFNRDSKESFALCRLYASIIYFLILSCLFYISYVIRIYLHFHSCLILFTLVRYYLPSGP